MRLINAEALYETAKNIWDHADSEDFEKEIFIAIATAPEIKPEPLTDKEQRWIPCSERLPEDGEIVLATHLGGLNPNRQVIEHVYANGKFTMGWDMDMNIDSPTFGQRYMGKVIAWMPLPKPYAERRTDE